MVHSTVFHLSLSLLKRLARLWWPLSLATHTQTHCSPSAAFPPGGARIAELPRLPRPSAAVPASAPSASSLDSATAPAPAFAVSYASTPAFHAAPQFAAPSNISAPAHQVPSVRDTRFSAATNSTPAPSAPVSSTPPPRRLRPQRLLPRRQLPRRRPLTQSPPQCLRLLFLLQLRKFRTRHLTSRHPAPWRHRPRRL